MNMRGYAWLNDEEEHSEAQEREVKRLAAQWSELYYRLEQESFARQSDYEDGYGGYEPDECVKCEGNGGMPDPEGIVDFINCKKCGGKGYDDTWEKEAAIRQEQEHLQLISIEAALHQHGARMMRAYEHWNEDEAYMAYQERDRSYE